MASGNFSGTHRIGAWWYVAWLAWFLCVALVMHFTQVRALSGEAALWCAVLLATIAGVLSVPLLFCPPRVLNLLILVPVWLFGAWFSLMSLWFPSFPSFGSIIGAFLWIGAFLLYSCGLIVAGIVWELAQRRGGRGNQP